MDEDREASRGRQVAGRVKELFGKRICNRRTEAGGARETRGGPGIHGLGDIPAPDPGKPN